MKSFIAWPVKLKDLSQELHITLKYLGDSPYTLINLGRRLAPHDKTFDTTKLTWTPELFAGQTRVLVLEGFNESLHKTRAAVEDLRPSDYPTWRPHISVPAYQWIQVARQGIQPLAMIESIGPLTLYVDKKPVCVFTDDRVF